VRRQPLPQTAAAAGARPEPSIRAAPRAVVTQGCASGKLLLLLRLAGKLKVYSASSDNFCKSHKTVFFQASAPKLLMFHKQKLRVHAHTGPGKRRSDKTQSGNVLLWLK